MHVELDGESWRTIPDGAVVRSGLRVGLELDRPLARTLSRELRRARALDAATRALRSRPLSERRLRERLRGRGIPATAEGAAVTTLAEAGYVDDGRLARGRAVALAERGWGDAAIAARLAGEGLGAADVEAALAELEPERARAERLASACESPRKTWSLLARRGFDAETIEALVGTLDAEVPDGLG
ncbi:MAG TPA: RecX family transcriptional regulator [Gaiellaceae bacterium]|nr:RecX family transcriptional regulator [Gaiellaceae bacterium]